MKFCMETSFYLYYVRNQLDGTLAVLFINNCKNVSDASRVHHQEYTNCSSSHWCMSWVGIVYIQYRRPRLVVYFTTDLGRLYWIYTIPTHDMHQWLLTTVYVLMMMDAVSS